MERMPGGRRRKRGAGAVIAWLASGFAVALLCACAYVAMLAFDANGRLHESADDLGRLHSALTAADASQASSAAKGATESAVESSRRAHGDTHNPVWRVAEFVPWAGANLVAVRQASEVTLDAVDHAVRPIGTLAGRVTPARFMPKDGRIDATALSSAAGALSTASDSLRRASSHADAIDTAGTIGPVRDAVRSLQKQLRNGSEEADAARRAALLLPGMLGMNGARDYLVLFQNNAEVRSTGGIPGALAVIHVDHGAITMTRRASSAAFPAQADATGLLSRSTLALYGDLPGRYIQDVTLPPAFELSGRLASTLWEQSTGQHVDGVVSIDPVALSYLLEATGSVPLSTGETLTAGNAVKILLSESYARYPVGQQDRFFARAATTVFAAATDGGANAHGMLAALARAGSEGRVLVWSARPNEQALIAQTSLAGALPSSSPGQARFGVYLNDATGAKMDYYLRSDVALGSALCRADGRADLAVAVTLRNTAPTDAATALPAYVTGGGMSGVAPGTILTQIAVYAPPGAAWLATTAKGRDVTAKAAIDDSRAVSRYTMELAPGESKTVQFDFLADASTTQTTASGRGGGSISAATRVAPAREDADASAPRGSAEPGKRSSSRPRVSAFVTPLIHEVSRKRLSVDCNAVIP
jgi:hypothetical protein